MPAMKAYLNTTSLDEESEEQPLAQPSKSRNPPQYIIKVPKDRIYKIPPPENQYLYNFYSKRVRLRQKHHSTCRRCLLWTTGILAILAILILILFIIGLSLYFTFHPQLPKYSVSNITVHNFNINSPDGAEEPEYHLSMRVENPNKALEMEYYSSKSSAKLYYTDEELGEGVWPSFTSENQNVTWTRSTLRRRPDVLLARKKIWGEISLEEKHGEVPLDITIEAPARVKFEKIAGTKKQLMVVVVFKVRCKVKVDRLSKLSKIVSNKCNVHVRMN